MEGEGRLQYLPVAASHQVGVGRLGVAQRAYPEFAVLQYLRVPDHHPVPGGEPAHGQAYPADQVLPEVHQQLSGG